MKAITPAVIENFYDWLPLDGEDKVTFNYSDGNAMLNIEYHDAGKLLSRKVTFEHASHFFKGPLQGGDFLAFEFGDQKLDVDCVVEYKNSEFASSYTKNYEDNIGAKLFAWKHYFVSFTSRNMVFHIFATDVSVSEKEVALNTD